MEVGECDERGRTAGGGGGGDGQRRDFERDEGETGLRNPCISIPSESLWEQQEREGGRKNGR